MVNNTVSVANVPVELVKDILKMYAINFEELKGQNKNDYSDLMSKYASEWDKDTSYGDFDRARLTGAFLSRIVLTHRIKYRKIYNIRHNGSGYAAACSKYDCWELAFAVFSKESEFHTEVIESVPNAIDASDEVVPGELDSVEEKPVPVTILTPSGRKKLAVANAANKKEQMYESTMKAHSNFAAVSDSFLRVNTIVEENEKLKNIKLRRELGMEEDPNN